MILVEYVQTKQISDHETYGKTDQKMNTTPENTTNLVENKKTCVNIKNCTH